MLHFPFFFIISENVFVDPCSITSTERITSTFTEIANECIATNPNECTKWAMKDGSNFRKPLLISKKKNIHWHIQSRDILVSNDYNCLSTKCAGVDFFSLLEQFWHQKNYKFLFFPEWGRKKFKQMVQNLSLPKRKSNRTTFSACGLKHMEPLQACVFPALPCQTLVLAHSSLYGCTVPLKTYVGKENQRAEVKPH